MELKRPDRFEPDPLGIDELVLSNVDMIHFERMDDGSMWVGLYRRGEIFTLRLYCRGKLKGKFEQES